MYLGMFLGKENDLKKVDILNLITAFPGICTANQKKEYVSGMFIGT